MKANDLEEIRRRFDGGRSDRSSPNEVLRLCDEIEQLRRMNADLGRQIVGLKRVGAEAQSTEGGA